MAELYKFFADQSTAEFFAILFLCLLFLGVVLYKYDVIDKRHLTPTGFDKVLIYSSIGITLFCGMLLFGKLVFPDNVEDLLRSLGLKGPLGTVTMNLQAIILGILGLLM